MTRAKLSSRDVAFWRAYLEILNERVPLVDRWRDGSVTWHPRRPEAFVVLQSPEHNAQAEDRLRLAGAERGSARAVAASSV